ncbi:MAG TPA: competence/damage-inducible protein A [Thermoanaerobaculia bacterium]|nr:competence/damage-inducible protein A [Thermoanaerobaculia bacterium]
MDLVTMRAAIIAVGTEMLGPTRLDTNSLKITEALERYGVGTARKSVVGDDAGEIAAELKLALSQCDLVIVTGGLGPTDDDVTREALARAFGLQTEVDATIVEKIAARFAARGLAMPEVNRRQALVFREQETLRNERGTAPGFHLSVSGRHVFVFPGVPQELEWMVETYLLPWLASKCGVACRQRRVLRVSGLSESALEEKLKPYYARHPGEPLTILASPSAIEVHLVADGSEESARNVIQEREQEIVRLLGDRIFGYDSDTLESVVGRLLTDRQESVSVAESCTGGLLSSRITDVSGSSRYFLGGAICYTADAKMFLAGVDPALIQEHGEVSEAVAIDMAKGIRRRFHTTWGIGVTGIAGPTGGTPEKPVGTVHIAVANVSGHQHRKLLWSGTRQQVKWFSTQAALDLLRRTLLAAEKGLPNGRA